MSFITQKIFDARNLLDVYLASALIAVVATRLFLKLTDYPQLGGEGFHIAHVLWGGLLMAVGTLILLLGQQPNRRLAAIVSGAGFGLFIDEVGKFVTSDVDYFYKPAALIIYVTFLVIWLVARWIITHANGHSFVEDVAWPRNKWLKRTLMVFLAMLGIATIIDVAQLVDSATTAPYFALYGANLIGYALYAINTVYVAMVLWAFVWLLRRKKKRSLTLMRAALVFGLVALLPAVFYTDQFEAFSLLIYYLAFLAIITENDSLEAKRHERKRKP